MMVAINVLMMGSANHYNILRLSIDTSRSGNDLSMEKRLKLLLDWRKPTSGNIRVQLNSRLGIAFLIVEGQLGGAQQASVIAQLRAHDPGSASRRSEGTRADCIF
jgi:hypothetical protein